ncbi:MAG: preprotein translocase subunit Sec61beta [Candidatus Hodarchaeales archaeon]|jgi:preprotein translocase subunit Sec61beta
MSRRSKKSKSDNPMPATGAGLIRFYSESDSPGIKVGPTLTFAFAIALIIFILIVNIFVKT